MPTREEFANAVRAVQDAEFQCGEWDSSHEEPYRVVHDRASAAHARLSALLDRVTMPAETRFPAAICSALLSEWPLSTVGTDEEICGGDVVEWLGELRECLEEATTPPADPVTQVSAAIEHLRAARELLKQAGAPRAADKVRAALSSTKGARRHARNADARTARQNGGF